MSLETLPKEVIDALHYRRITRMGLFVNFPYKHETHEKTLWRACLDRALVDAVTKDKPPFHNDRVSHTEFFQEANAWFDLSNPDFNEVCALGDLDPIFVYDVYLFCRELHFKEPILST